MRVSPAATLQPRRARNYTPSMRCVGINGGPSCTEEKSRSFSADANACRHDVRRGLRDRMRPDRACGPWRDHDQEGGTHHNRLEADDRSAARAPAHAGHRHRCATCEPTATANTPALQDYDAPTAAIILHASSSADSSQPDLTGAGFRPKRQVTDGSSPYLASNRASSVAQNWAVASRAVPIQKGVEDAHGSCPKGEPALTPDHAPADYVVCASRPEGRVTGTIDCNTCSRRFRASWSRTCWCPTGLISLELPYAELKCSAWMLKMHVTCSGPSTKRPSIRPWSRRSSLERCSTSTVRTSEIADCTLS